MRHAVFVALLALATSSLSLTAEARWHHWHHRWHHHHHHRHYRHHHRWYYLQARHIDHHRHHRTHAMRQLPPAPGTRTPFARQSRYGQDPGDASAGRQSIPQQHAVPQPKSPAVAAAPAAAGTAKAVASAAPARRAPDWKYPPATLKRVPGGKQHVLAPDTDSFVIIPGYKIVK